jgi:hypothetical protein
MAKVPKLSPPESVTRGRPDAHPNRVPAKALARRRGLFERLDHWFWRQHQHDIEAYLAKATDVYDLEARIRALERNVPHPYY